MEQKFSSFPFLFCRFPNMVIFEEFLTLDDVLGEVFQALDEAVAHLLPPPLTSNRPHLLPLSKSIHHRAMHKLLPPGLLSNFESESDSDDEMDQEFPWRNIQDIPSFQLMNIMSYAPQQSDLIEHDILDIENSSYILLPLLITLTTVLGMNCQGTESVVFHPVEQINNSISSWIITAAIDCNPYRDALFNVN